MNTEIFNTFQDTIPNESPESIPLKLLCDFFGLNYEYHYKYLQKHPGFKGHLMREAHPEIYHDSRKRYHLGKKSFVRWVLHLNYQDVRSDLQEAFLEYQEFINDYIFKVDSRDEKLKNKAALKARIKSLRTELRQNKKFLEWEYANAELMRNEKDIQQIDNEVVKQLTIWDESDIVESKNQK